jgi:4,5-DOPA dioxygenase extradiol
MTPNSSHVTRQPALFLSHGSPMNALADNEHTRAWQRIGRELIPPRAIITVSAHWYTRGTFVTAEARPKTIHDFGGFPPALYEIAYPAPGEPSLAAKVVDQLVEFNASSRTDWGLDHGTWSVLRHVFPSASIPVIQVSIDATRPWSDQLAIGRRLSALRDDGVLLVGSGGIVHNLSRVDWSGQGAVPEWATRFEQWVCDRAVSGDVAPLADTRQFDDAGRIAVPTPDHYLPLLTVLGSRRDDEGVSILHRGYELGTISLTALRVG